MEVSQLARPREQPSNDATLSLSLSLFTMESLQCRCRRSHAFVSSRHRRMNHSAHLSSLRLHSLLIESLVYSSSSILIQLLFFCLPPKRDREIHTKRRNAAHNRFVFSSIGLVLLIKRHFPCKRRLRMRSLMTESIVADCRPFQFVISAKVWG